MGRPTRIVTARKPKRKKPAVALRSVIVETMSPKQREAHKRWLRLTGRKPDPP